MKKIGAFVLVYAACFLGVIAALRFDDIFLAKKPDLLKSFNGVPPAMPIDYQPGAPFDFRAAAKKLTPSVVSVDRSEAMRDFFSDRVSLVPAGSGSGVIIGEEGYILTNNHVVADAASVQVRLSDNRSFEATIVGTDPRSDLAVLKINAKNLVPAELGISNKLEVGEWVMAVGNPLGFSNTVSVGVVSSLKRTLPAGREGTLLIDTIQTDAAINGGNSGGALANAQGQVVGINTAIATPNQGSVGIGFAIPIDRAKRVVEEIVKFGRVKYGDPGFSVYEGPNLLQNQRSRRAMERALGVAPPTEGLIISEVRANSPAAKAGLKQLDVVLEVDGKKMVEPSVFLKSMIDKKVGDSISLKVWASGNTKTIKLDLADVQSF